MAFGMALSVRSRVRECTPALFNQVVDSGHTARVCAGIEDALEKVRRGEMCREDFETFKAEQKKRLAVFTPHAMFPKGRRVNADAVPSGLSMYDIDHIGQAPDSLTPGPSPKGEGSGCCLGRVLRGQVLRREPITDKNLIAELKRLGICLVHVTPSTEGLRLFFVMPEGMNLEEAQKWMSGQLGDADYDGCVKDYARSSFVVPESYVLYLDEEELFREREEVNAPLPPLISEGESDTTVGAESVAGVTISPSKIRGGQGALASEDSQEALTFKGTPYSDIIAQWFRLVGGEPQTGERNDKLHRLASHLRYITDNSEELMLRVMPRYGLSEQEMRQLIHSACQSKWCSMPKMMREAISSLTPSPSPKEGGVVGGEVPPAMPKRLPKLIQLLVSKTPQVYQPAVAHAVFPALGAHLWKVRFRYIDNVCHEATLMNVLMAGTGAGKDCISQPINHIMRDVRARDAENLKREADWKKEVNSKGANKDKRQRPEGLVIQEVDPDMTNPAFVMRMAEADEHFLYTKMNEIDQFDALRGSARGSQQFQIMCLSFDPDNRYGQTRVGTQSVTEKVCIRFNWNAATTIQKGQRYFSRVLTDGPISRINFCTIPEREIGAEMPVYGTYDADFDEELRPYIERLTRASGEIDCPQAYRLAKKLKDECAEFARLSQSRVYENLSFRANVIAWLKACVLYVANGYKWDKTLEDFIRWSLHYDLWCKMRFFGPAIEEASQAGGNEPTKGPRNLLELLPDEFTTHDADLIRQAQGMSTAGTKNMLWQWVHRGYALRLTVDSYRKLKFLSNHGTDIRKNR